MPPPTGCAIWFKPGFASVKGGTTFSINGSSFLPVKIADLSDINVGDILTTSWILIFFDGTQWLVIGGANRAPGQLPLLQANQNWYVNTTTGSDTIYDGTSATVSGTHGPFKTIQRGVTETSHYNMNGYNQTVNVADGTYTEGAGVNVPAVNGSGSVIILGNQSSPQNVSVSSSGTNACTFNFASGGTYQLRGFRLLNVGVPCWDGVAVSYNNNLTTSNLRFGPCTRSHISAYSGGNVTFDGGTITIEASANVVNAGHIYCIRGNVGTWGQASPVTALNILGAVSMPNFIICGSIGSTNIFYSSITGAGNVTAAKYSVSSNGVIDSAGNGVNYYPGTSAGVAVTGGQYV
jgi:hypothetical protein